jgi:internalin A
MMKLSRLVLSMSIGQLMIMALAYFDFAQHKQPLLWNIGGATSASASPQQPKPKSFAQWCQQKKSVPADTRHTIDVLLEEADTKDCQKADTKLRNLTTLDLNSNKIINVKPMAGLTNLTTLDLNSNQIIDVQPLAGLTKLTLLYLGSNKIIDVQPLAGLTKLNYLDLYSNQIAVKTCPVKPEEICKWL